MGIFNIFSQSPDVSFEKSIYDFTVKDIYGEDFKFENALRICICLQHRLGFANLGFETTQTAGVRFVHVHTFMCIHLYIC